MSKATGVLVVLALTFLIIAPVGRGLFHWDFLFMPCLIAGLAFLVAAVISFAIYVAKSKQPPSAK
ncbi:MAG: hypothetical protein ACJ790_22960 [Myxococcaceae bacterium]